MCHSEKPGLSGSWAVTDAFKPEQVVKGFLMGSDLSWATLIFQLEDKKQGVTEDNEASRTACSTLQLKVSLGSSTALQ